MSGILNREEEALAASLAGYEDTWRVSVLRKRTAALLDLTRESSIFFD